MGLVVSMFEQISRVRVASELETSFSSVPAPTVQDQGDLTTRLWFLSEVLENDFPSRTKSTQSKGNAKIRLESGQSNQVRTKNFQKNIATDLKGRQTINSTDVSLKSKANNNFHREHQHSQQLTRDTDLPYANKRSPARDHLQVTVCATEGLTGPRSGKSANVPRAQVERSTLTSQLGSSLTQSKHRDKSTHLSVSLASKKGGTTMRSKESTRVVPDCEHQGKQTLHYTSSNNEELRPSGEFKDCKSKDSAHSTISSQREQIKTLTDIKFRTKSRSSKQPQSRQSSAIPANTTTTNNTNANTRIDLDTKPIDGAHTKIVSNKNAKLDSTTAFRQQPKRPSGNQSPKASMRQNSQHCPSPKHLQQIQLMHLQRQKKIMSSQQEDSTSDCSTLSASSGEVFDQANHVDPHPVPPPRPWLWAQQQRVSNHNCSFNQSHFVGHSEGPEFTVITYNVLADRCAKSDYFPSSPVHALDWNYRREIILRELLRFDADVIALQEVELDHYEKFFRTKLAEYDSIYGQKSRARNVGQFQNRGRVDGCAIFFKRSKFRLVKQHLIEFNRTALANARTCGPMVARVMYKDNIGLAAILEFQPTESSPQPRHVLVCNTHLHWNPMDCDVKLVQTLMLMKELESIVMHHKMDIDPKWRNRLASYDVAGFSAEFAQEVKRGDVIPIVLLGDFNSTPNSGVIDYVTGGDLTSVHHDFKENRYTEIFETLSCEQSDLPCQNCLAPKLKMWTKKSANLATNLRSNPNTMDENDDDSDDDKQVITYTHPFQLASAYGTDTMPYTNYTTSFKDIIDYIFYSPKTVQLLGLLGPLDNRWLEGNQIVGLPQPHLPSDHLPLLVKFKLNPIVMKQPQMQPQALSLLQPPPLPLPPQLLLQPPLHVFPTATYEIQSFSRHQNHYQHNHHNHHNHNHNHSHNHNHNHQARVQPLTIINQQLYRSF